MFYSKFKRPYECPEKGCGKKFRQAGCLKNHRASQHGSDVSFDCDVSYDVSETFTHFNLYILSQLCGKQFPVKERLRLHLRVHRFVDYIFLNLKLCIQLLLNIFSMISVVRSRIDAPLVTKLSQEAVNFRNIW